MVRRNSTSFPHLALQAGTNHPIRKNQENHVICTHHEDKDVSLLSEKVWPEALQQALQTA